jgi:hypothetical protein
MPYIVFLVVTATALYFAKWPILVIAALVLLCNGWLWFDSRYPRTPWFLIGFMRGLMGRRWVHRKRCILSTAKTPEASSSYLLALGRYLRPF